MQPPLGRGTSPPSPAPFTGHVSVSLSLCQHSVRLFLVPRFWEALAGSGSDLLLPPSPQAPSQVPHAFQQPNEDRDACVCPEARVLGSTMGGGSWEKPSGCFRGGCPSDFPALLSFSAPKGEVTDPWDHFLTGSPFQATSLIALLGSSDNSHQALNAKHVASVVLHTSHASSFNPQSNPGHSPIIIPGLGGLRVSVTCLPTRVDAWARVQGLKHQSQHFPASSPPLHPIIPLLSEARVLSLTSTMDLVMSLLKPL